MVDSIVELAESSSRLESKIFSLPRLLLLKTLRDLDRDGASFRELVASLRLPEGIIFANLKILEQLEYIQSEPIEMDGRKMTSFHITERGEEEFDKAKEWLKILIG